MTGSLTRSHSVSTTAHCPETVDGYVFKQPSQDRGFPLAELTEQQHRTALENGFGKQVIYGYENVLKTLKQGYASIGYKRGRNIHVEFEQVPCEQAHDCKRGQGLPL